MSLRNVKQQNIDVVKTNQPELYQAIQNRLPDLTDEQKGVVAGLCIEFVITSGGDPDVFVLGEGVRDKDEMLAWNTELDD